MDTLQQYQFDFPAITRPDSGIALVSKWTVEDSRYQKAAGDAAAEVWDHLPWPGGLLSHSVYLGSDGTTIMQYSQWTNEEAIEAFQQNHLPERAKKAYETVPGLERVEAVRYRLYRSMISERPFRRPGCIILVSFETDSPELQKTFVNSLIKTVENRSVSHHHGSIASHFHLSTDGKRVLNYAEFTSERAHDEMLQSSLQKDDAVPRLISSIPGLKPLGFERFHLYKSISQRTFNETDESP